MRTPSAPSLIPNLMDGSIKVFPVAIRFFNMPSTSVMKDMYQFARRFGSVEKVTEIQPEDEEEEGSFRVQYLERYNVLLILQNRGRLVVDGKVISAEPLFV